MPAAWRAFLDDDDVKIGSVTVGPGGFLAAGCRTDADGNCERRIAVSSPDGPGWTASELDVTVDIVANRSAWSAIGCPCSAIAGSARAFTALVSLCMTRG